jgi:hypothetical protein
LGRNSLEKNKSLNREDHIKKLKELEEIDFLCSIDRNQDSIKKKVQEAYRRDP